MNPVYFREVVFMKVFILPLCFSAKPLFPLHTHHLSLLRWQLLASDRYFSTLGLHL